MSSGVENRRYSRVDSRLRCWCEGENVTVYARIHNLSEGGLFLRTSTPLSLGSKAVVRFGEPGIEATAMVVWSRGAESQGGPAGMGLQFVEVDESRKDLIRRMVERELQGNRPKSKQP